MQRLLSCVVLSILAACGLVRLPGRSSTETIVVDTREGTALAFDLAPEDSSIVFDLLGQLWIMPAHGGDARAVTDAVRDTAEDLDPSISPNGRSVVFRAERNGRRGLWLLDLADNGVRQLMQRAKPDEYEGEASWSPDGRTIAFARVAPDSAGREWHSRIRLLDVASGAVRDLQVEKTQKLEMRDPTWTPDGRRIAFVAASPASPRGGRIWMVDAGGGHAAPLSPDSIVGIAPAFAPDGKRIAFLARDSTNHFQVWVQELAGSRAGPPVRLTDHEDVASTRVRWTHDGAAVVYAADGRLRRIGARDGGRESAVIPFRARLVVTRPAHNLPPAQLVEVGGGNVARARAFLGAGLSPDGQRIAAIALGKLWIMPVGGAARALVDVPFTARGLAWSPETHKLFVSDESAEVVTVIDTNTDERVDTIEMGGEVGRRVWRGGSVRGRRPNGRNAPVDGVAWARGAACVFTGWPIHRVHAPKWQGRAACDRCARAEPTHRHHADAQLRARLGAVDTHRRHVSTVEPYIRCPAPRWRVRGRQADDGNTGAAVRRARHHQRFHRCPDLPALGRWQRRRTDVRAA